MNASPRPRPPLPKGCRGVTMCLYGAASCRRGVHCSFAHSAAELQSWHKASPNEQRPRGAGQGGGQVMQAVWVSADCVGLVVGTRGSRLNHLQRSSDVHIQTPRDLPPKGATDQKVAFMVRGSSEKSVAAACARISQLAERSTAPRCTFCSSRAGNASQAQGKGGDSAAHCMMDGLKVTCPALQLHRCSRCGALGHSQGWCSQVKGTAAVLLAL